jgi:hypothetical protein
MAAMTIIIIFLPRIANWMSRTVVNAYPGKKSSGREMFDVCFAMFGVTMSSQQNWK